MTKLGNIWESRRQTYEDVMLGDMLESEDIRPFKFYRLVG